MEIFVFINYFSKNAFLTKMAYVKTWKCCLKRRPSKAKIFHALPLVSAWGRKLL